MIAPLDPAGAPGRFAGWRPSWEAAIQALYSRMADPAWWAGVGFDPRNLSPGEVMAGLAVACLELGLPLGRAQLLLLAAGMFREPDPPIRCVGPGSLRVRAAP